MLIYLKITLTNGRLISKHWHFKTKWHLERMEIFIMVHTSVRMLLSRYSNQIALMRTWKRSLLMKYIS